MNPAGRVVTLGERQALGQSCVGNWRKTSGGGRGLTEVSPGVLKSLGLGVEGGGGGGGGYLPSTTGVGAVYCFTFTCRN